MEHINSTHKGIVGYVCDHVGCGLIFSTKYLWRKHRKSHKIKDQVKEEAQNESKTPITQPGLNSSYKYHCGFRGCEFQANDYFSFNRHKESVHIDKRKYFCDWKDCGQSFKRQLHLNEHTMTHNNDKPFRCSKKGCNFKSIKASNLIVRSVHLERTHYSSGQYAY